MDKKDLSGQEVTEEMHYARLQSLVQKLTGTSAPISRLVLDLMDECWCHNNTRAPWSIPHMPLECKAPENTDSLLQTTHCHFRKAPCCSCWRKSSVCNLGMRVAPMEIWNRWLNLYTMRKWPRGHCIIIGNVLFNGSPKEQEGCLDDVRRMRGLFLALHFKCTIATNLKADEMKTLLRWAAGECDEKKDDCLVVVLMCHGKENYIYGVDFEPLHLYNDVYEQFNNENCPELKGKPKLFLVQATREENHSQFTNTVPKTSDPGCVSAEACNASPASKTPDPRPTWSDMYIAHATIPGYVELSKEESGLWFVSAVYEVFFDHAHIESLAELMRRVHDVILSRSSHDGSRQTPCTEQFGWRKKLYFYPGRMHSRITPKHGSFCSTLRFMEFSKRERILYGVVRRLPREPKIRVGTYVEEKISSSEEDSQSE
ncbi:caspase-3-like isoform X2 [Amblyomma americanum]